MTSYFSLPFHRGFSFYPPPPSSTPPFLPVATCNCLLHTPVCLSPRTVVQLCWMHILWLWRCYLTCFVYKFWWQEVTGDNIRDLVIEIRYRYFIPTLQWTHGGPDVLGSVFWMVRPISDSKQCSLPRCDSDLLEGSPSGKLLESLL